MNKKNTDFNKTIMYKIQHKENKNLIYVGSTDDLIERIKSHKKAYYNQNSQQYNYKVYRMIRENGGFNMFLFNKIECFSCKDKCEARKRETELMTELKSTMNSIRAYSGDKEEIICVCGCKIKGKSRIRHLRRNIHLGLMEKVYKLKYDECMNAINKIK